ncbi:amidohydrolase family protein [Akkermansiaceae bacterium]|nr:amidohydrolase family protein [Akkermansiaceae bacterium]
MHPSPLIRRRCILRGTHLLLLVLCTLGLAVPHFHAQQAAKESAPPEDLHIYLLIGQSNMAGRAEIPEDAEDIIGRCYLLNGEGTWEPASNPLNRHSSVRKDLAMQKLGPGYSFAREMLAKDKDARIGLIVNARGGTKIDEWLGKSELYWGARKRTKAALKDGTLKGILWHQGESDMKAPEAYLVKLQTLAGNLRADFGDPNLPFIAGQIHKGDAINEQIAKLPEATHATAVASSEGLTTTDGTHFDTESQLLLGKRYAEQMLRVQAALPPAPKPPSDIRFIDPHVHAMSVTPLGLRAVAKWMEERNVERCIVSPLNHKGSRPQNEEEHAAMLANFLPYKGKIDRMAIIDAGEVETAAQAVAILEKEKAEGAIAFGEHYGVGLMFDDPKNLMLYEACEKVGLPVMFHIDQNKNMVEPGMARVDRVLKMFPKCKVVAHAYWWRQLKDADRQLQEHPNLYADMSGHVVVQVLNRDRKFAREFLIRNQDKILWATDEGWWSFGSKDRQMNQHYTFFESLDLPQEVREKIYRGNAEKVYGLK